MNTQTGQQSTRPAILHAAADALDEGRKAPDLAEALRGIASEEYRQGQQAPEADPARGEYLTVEETAALLKRSPKSVYRLADAGRLTLYRQKGRIRGGVRFLRSEVEDVLKPEPAKRNTGGSQ